MPDLARKIECLLCVSTSTAGCSDAGSPAGEKKVGTGTYTPVGGIRGSLVDILFNTKGLVQVLQSDADLAKLR